MGVQILNNAFKGFNSCLFAYGQSGAGKSYSMTANPPDEAGKGIVPRAAKQIFKRRDENKDPTVQQTIEVQMVEIYNEKIRDLLRPDENPPDGLDLRDHPELGPTLYRDRDIWPPVRSPPCLLTLLLMMIIVVALWHPCAVLSSPASCALRVKLLFHTYASVAFFHHCHDILLLILARTHVNKHTHIQTYLHSHTHAFIHPSIHAYHIHTGAGQHSRSHVCHARRRCIQHD